MNFEKMIGTTGIASKGSTLYVANNKVITSIDSSEKTMDIPHKYDTVEAIVVSGNMLAGIFIKDKRYGIFLLDLDTKKFTSKYTLFRPYKIVISPDSTLVGISDNKFSIYIYDIQLAPVRKIDSGIKEAYTRIDIATNKQTTNQEFFMTNKTIKRKLQDTNTVFSLEPTDGEFLAIEYYENTLFIFYTTLANMFSVARYEISTNKMSKEIDGGPLTNNIYVCIHNNSVYISSTVNKVIPLSQFSGSPNTNNTNDANISSHYPSFELNSIQPDLWYDSLEVDVKSLKEKNENFEVDIKPAERNLFFYYIWVMVTIILVGLIYFSLTSSNPRAVNMIILLIIVISAVFIIREYI
jgi:hypothetical protein